MVPHTHSAVSVRALSHPRRYLTILLIPVFSCSVLSQVRTVGLIQSDAGAHSGYTLFAPLSSTTTYLIDANGLLVRSWKSSFRPGNSVYLLENGHLLRTGTVANNVFRAGGSGGIVEEYDWDGSLLWQYRYSDNRVLQHHDIEPLPGGTVLLLAWEYKSAAEAIAAGRNPNLIREGALWPDHIIEVRPVGTDSAVIVWEWHLWDHLIQDFDSTKQNYGPVDQHPERVHINFVRPGPGSGGSDWNHCNAIDYNARLDQIIISVHEFSEVWMIDHSTTTEEAKGHTGGRYGRGGDLLYRWGNPQAYRSGKETDQKLFLQHDAHWIPAGLQGEENILLFNNGQLRSRNFSSVDEIATPVDSSGQYARAPGYPFGPPSAVWSYTAKNPNEFYASNISGAQRLPNGNTLICDGPHGTFFEVTPAGETRWKYVNPVTQSGILTQGDVLHGEENSVFRASRYTMEYPGLSGRDLTPGNPIELYAPADTSFPVVDTGQENCFDNRRIVPFPGAGDPFYGQDAQNQGNQPMYRDNGDGTISDLVTGLMWQKQLFPLKKTYSDALADADTFQLAGYTDWRLPSIKELYSLIDFRGVTGMTPAASAPYIDTTLFEFRYGGVTNPNERMIDAQYATRTVYTGTTMGGNPTMFGVNFADGRIKGYPQSKEFEVRYVRGNPLYGQNALVDNGDGTITDRATSLMWERSGSSYGMNWEDALAWVYEKNQIKHLGYDDWRLPNAKELQSIVDYSRSPSATQSAAISPLFHLPAITVEGGLTDYPFYWSSTTHEDGPAPDKAVYIAFGRALGFMEIPPGSGNYQLQDVHGAGAQRSDPKSGDPNNYPHGQGPQGDVIRIFNYVITVRDASTTTGMGLTPDYDIVPTGYSLLPNYPDPFHASTTIEFSLPMRGETRLEIRNILGQKIANIVNGCLEAGTYRIRWQPASFPAGIYLATVRSGAFSRTEKMILLK